MKPQFKTSLKALAAALGLGMVLASGSAVADSTYGYDTNAANNVTATANLRVPVSIPKLILLRVGSSSTTVDAVTFNATPNIPTLPAVAAVGASQAATWDGTAPTFSATPTGAVVSAYLWHNATAGATLSCSATTAFTSGLTAADITVSSGAGMAHPGANTACGTPTTPLARSTVHTGTWTYGISAAAMANAAAGSDFEIVTYTAVTL